MATAHVVAAIATLILTVVAVGRVFGRAELAGAMRGRWLPGFVRFSVPLGVADLLNAVLQRTDILLLTDGWYLFQPDQGIAQAVTADGSVLPGVYMGPGGRLTVEETAARMADLALRMAGVRVAVPA